MKGNIERVRCVFRLSAVALSLGSALALRASAAPLPQQAIVSASTPAPSTPSPAAATQAATKPAAKPPENADLLRRLGHLENENARLRSDVAALRVQLQALSDSYVRHYHQVNGEVGDGLAVVDGKTLVTGSYVDVELRRTTTPLPPFHDGSGSTLAFPLSTLKPIGAVKKPRVKPAAKKPLAKPAPRGVVVPGTPAASTVPPAPPTASKPLGASAPAHTPVPSAAPTPQPVK